MPVKWAGDERAGLGMLKGKAGLVQTRKENPGGTGRAQAASGENVARAGAESAPRGRGGASPARAGVLVFLDSCPLVSF